MIPSYVQCYTNLGIIRSMYDSNKVGLFATTICVCRSHLKYLRRNICLLYFYRTMCSAITANLSKLLYLIELSNLQVHTSLKNHLT